MAFDAHRGEGGRVHWAVPRLSATTTPPTPLTPKLDPCHLALSPRPSIPNASLESKLSPNPNPNSNPTLDPDPSAARYIGELSTALGGDFVNLGRCHSAGRAESEAELRARGGIDAFISRGLFYLAIENANCEDYVTEKLGRAMVAGVVPVVFSAPQRLAGGSVDGGSVPDYGRFMPPHTYINIADFATPVALAAHLRACASNRTLYESYLWPQASSSVAEVLGRWPQHATFRMAEREEAVSTAEARFWAARANTAAAPSEEEERAECILAKGAIERLWVADQRGK